MPGPHCTFRRQARPEHRAGGKSRLPEVIGL